MQESHVLTKEQSLVTPSNDMTWVVKPDEKGDPSGFEEANRQAKAALAEEKLFTADGRRTIEQLYEAYDRLEAEGWTKELIYTQSITTHDGREISYPVFAYSWKGVLDQSLWILGGVHGEEPAGPNAFAESIEEINDLKNQGISTLFVPLLNPVGYYRDWRYFEVARDRKAGFSSSVTDSDHVLPSTDSGHEGEFRHHEPRNRFAEQVISWFTQKSKDFPPLLVFDHHEDLLEKDAPYTYSYVNGDPHNQLILDFCQQISDMFVASGFPIKMSGKTNFEHIVEEIVNGFVWNSEDGSVDEYASYLGAVAVFVLETTRMNELDDQLPKRITAHQNIIKLYQSFYKQLLAQVTKKMEAAPVPGSVPA